MGDDEFVMALNNISSLQSEIEAIADGVQSDTGAAHVMTINLHTWLCMCADLLVDSPSDELQLLLNSRIRAGEPLSKGIIEDIESIGD